MDEQSFKEELAEFYRRSNMTFREKRCPSVGGKDLNLYLLFKHVVSAGGYDAVTAVPKHKGWEETVVTVCGHDVLTGPAVPRRCREQYEKRLLAFERHKNEQESHFEPEAEPEPEPEPQSDMEIEPNQGSAGVTDDHNYIDLGDSDETDPHRIAQIHDLLDGRDLDPRQMLTTSIVSEFMRKLTERDNSVYGFDSQFMSTLNHMKAVTPGLKRYTGRPGQVRFVDIFEKRVVFFPVILSPIAGAVNHWALAVANMTAHTISYYDSCTQSGWINTGNTNYEPANPQMHLILDYLREEHLIKRNNIPLPDDWRVNLVGRSEDVPLKVVNGKAVIPQQENGYDCGVFLCKYADHISQGIPFTGFEEDAIADYREEIRSFLGIAPRDSESVQLQDKKPASSTPKTRGNYRIPNNPITTTYPRIRS